MALFKVDFLAECFNHSVSVNVLVPSDFTGPPELAPPLGPYKTVYLLHGYRGDSTSWLLNSQVEEMSRQFNIAIVMPSGYNGFYVDAPRSGIRGSEFIGRELVEFTRKLFPLSREQDDTILAGYSMGAYGAIYNSLKHRDVFGHAVALSALIIPDRRLSESEPQNTNLGLTEGFFKALHGDTVKIMETDRNLALLAKQTLASDGPLPDLYIACGCNDMLVRENREFTNQLNAMGFPHFYEEGPGTHEWLFWNGFLRRGLRHTIGDEQYIMPNPFWIDEEGGL